MLALRQHSARLSRSLGLVSRHLSTSGTSPAIFDVNEDNVKARVFESKVPVLLDAYADWCGPCKLLSPVLEKAIKAEAGKVVLAKLNVDEAREVAALLQVELLPTVFGVKDGKIVEKFTGVVTEQQLKLFIDRLKSAEVPKSS